jgi:hypothetical protein
MKIESTIRYVYFTNCINLQTMYIKRYQLSISTFYGRLKPPCGTQHETWHQPSCGKHKDCIYISSRKEPLVHISKIIYTFLILRHNWSTAILQQTSEWTHGSALLCFKYLQVKFKIFLRRQQKIF